MVRGAGRAYIEEHVVPAFIETRQTPCCSSARKQTWLGAIRRWAAAPEAAWDDFVTLLDLVDEPLATLPLEKVRPGKDALDEVMDSLR